MRSAPAMYSALLAASLYASVGAADTATLPRDDGYQHLGVASCNSAGCHGDQVYGAGAGPVVGQNEVLTWKSPGVSGAHSRAYAVLNSEWGQRIGRNLGMDDPREESACLDCHANNVPPSQRGRRFQISDGVSCESCHGGAEQWLSYHRLGAGHEKNVERGLYPTADPQNRAQLCASCHQGRVENEQFVSHELMGAGHPRLVFELDRYTALQAHHQVDADYAQRKTVAGSAQSWALGQILSARRQLQLLNSPRARGSGGFPEFSLYDCQACHQPLGQGLQSLDWRPHPLRRRPSGTAVLQDANLIMVRAIVTAAQPEQLASFDRALQSWHQDPGNADQSSAAAQALDAQLNALLQQALRQTPAPQTLLSTLLQPRFIALLHELAAAEQWVLALHSLLIEVAPTDAQTAWESLQRLQQRVEKAHRYNRYALAQEAQPLRQWLQTLGSEQP